jgi:hypothetical protein
MATNARLGLGACLVCCGGLMMMIKTTFSKIRHLVVVARHIGKIKPLGSDHGKKHHKNA